MRMTQKQIVEYNRLERGGQTRGNVLEVPRNEVLRAVLTKDVLAVLTEGCLLYTSPSPRDGLLSRMPSSA